MSMVINTNTASLNAQRNLMKTQNSMNTALERLSSGLRINSAKDDAAGLAIATRMDSQSRGMVVAQRNANDALSMMQTADGAMGQIADNLQRMSELANQASSGQFGTTDLANLDAEFQQLGQEIGRIAGGTTFNGQAIIGANAAAFAFHIGAGTTANDTISVTTKDLTADATITAVTGGSITSNANATTALGNIKTALDTINTERANNGAYQSRFEGVISNLSVSIENTNAAKSRIMDADFAAETANLTKAQILQQAGTAMLSQANQLPQSVLSLLK